MSQVRIQPAISPIHERSYAPSEEARAVENNLRGLRNNSNQFPPLYSGLGNGDFEWNTLPSPYLVSPMSDQRSRGIYGTPSSGVGDAYQAHPGIGQRPSREQLPPLSSIFATPRQGAPSRASYPDRSPTFPILSPQDTRQSSTPQQQALDLSYSQGLPSTPKSILSHNTRSASSELPPPLRRMHINRLPPTSSPHSYEAQHSPRENSSSNRLRTQLPTSRSSSPPQSERPYQGYFVPVWKDASFRPQLDQQPVHPRREEMAPTEECRDMPQNTSPTAPRYPPPAASTTVFQEQDTTRDALGPKIWTGTQFLPRFVRQAEIPGEGLCYFYDDGTHCKTHIDGEPVNAHWGVTKAGKPRKRLAIACITCREKKIKCDPDYPRCIQCEKFGRVCKFKNAPRGSQGSPETPPSDADEVLLRPLSHRSDCQPYTRPVKREFARSSSPRSSNRHQSLESEVNSAKRRKFDNGSTPVKTENEQANLSQNGSPAPSRRPSSDAIVECTENANLMEWMIDPLASEEELVVELMNIYFIYLESATLYMLPKKPFMLWLTDRRIRKSSDDLMLIYAILATSTVFSSNPDHRKRGKEFATISRHACDRRRFSLQLVQSRLLLALYYYANGNQPDCWDFYGGALRVATGMKLNLEIGRTEEDNANLFPYNLNRNGYAECRRRTFWSCYIMERFNSFSNGYISMIRPEDIFLRLPCDVKSFEEQTEVHNPYFDHSTPPIRNTYGNIGPMAYLINIVSIWGDVMANIYRSSVGPFTTDPTTCKAFYEVITSRLEAWHSSLPDYVSFSPENIVKTSNLGTLGVLITIHSLYQSAQMKLNHHVSSDIPSPEQLETNIRRTHHHAEALIQIADSLTKRHTTVSRGIALKDNDGPIPISSPFIGFAIASAVDTLSAKGYLSRLPEFPLCIQGAVRVLDDLAKYWQSARSQREAVAARLADAIASPTGWKGTNPRQRYQGIV